MAKPRSPSATSLQLLAACNVALALPAVFIALAAKRYLVGGLAAGAVKS